MPASALLIAGVVAAVGAVGLLWTVARLRRRVDAVRRLLVRVEAAADEVDRVDRARRQLAGIPYAILRRRRDGS